MKLITDADQGWTLEIICFAANDRDFDDDPQEMYHELMSSGARDVRTANILGLPRAGFLVCELVGDPSIVGADRLRQVFDR